MVIIRQSECDYNAVFIPFRREECWKEQHKYDKMICRGIKWNYVILLFTLHSLHKDEHILRTFYVPSRLCRFIVFLPCDIFSSPLLCPSTIFPICSHSSCVSIEGVRGGEGRGGEGSGDRGASQRASVPFINIRISIAARHLKSQLRNLSTPCANKSRKKAT